ncbi:MAG TPA: ATP-binding protein, partial [Polyangiaceae bacterium]|nr:ATP-binding protein [Polyangiaceae bacterium]
MADEPSSLDIAARLAREEALRANRLVRAVIPVLVILLFAQAILYALAPNTKLVLTALVYLPAFGVLALAQGLLGTPRARWSGWMVVSLLWLLPSSALWFLGGLSYEIGSGQIVSVIAAAAILGGRPAFLYAGLSIVDVALVTWAQTAERLPPPPVPMAPINAALSLGGSLLVGAALVHFLISGLRDAMMKTLQASSERDAARIRFLQAQKMEPVGRLASGVAHDFNNLLTVMTGVTSLLRSGERDPKFVASLLDDMDSATARATLMTGQLLAFTRSRPVEPEVLDIASATRKMIPLLARLIGDDVLVKFDVEEGAVRVRADRGQFEQVILNLAVNARDAMPEGGELAIGLRPSKDMKQAIVTVSDTGVGIEPALIDKIFTPFFTTKRTGTGLGLATVRDIVAQYSGKLELDSTPGRGTRVTIAFPLVEAVETRQESNETVAVTARSGRLLLVEDHDLVRRTNRRALEHAGYEVTAVLDGA